MSTLDNALEAVKSGNVTAFRALLAADPALADATIDGGMSLLLLAVFFGHGEIIDAMLATGRTLNIYEAAALGKQVELTAFLDADPSAINAFSSYGFTPLHHAAYMADVSTVRLLLDRGADVNAVSRDHMQLTPLHQAAVKGKRDMVAMLLDHGANPTPPHPQGYTPLHAAAGGGDLVSIRRLLTMGADPTQTFQGKTAADIAMEKGHKDAAAAIRAEMV
ncbi:MAG: ankyrin repeat domain-containing protein [Planctomycetes bacterium]|nr:ankyrin repeat domain-containing protein [Planctomycetota bacterium]